MSNGNAAAALMVTVAMLTGMSHVHGAPARRHATTRDWSSPERAELDGSRIPVRTVRRSYAERARPGGRLPERAGAPEKTPEVIVGYVDPARGSTAFHRLTNVVEGDRVKVVRRDHSFDWYTVDSIRRTVRRDIDRKRSASGRPELRLISWRGARDPRNVVVSAHLDRPPREPDVTSAHPDKPSDVHAD